MGPGLLLLRAAGRLKGNYGKVEGAKEGATSRLFSFLSFTTCCRNDPLLEQTGLETLQSKALLECLPSGCWLGQMAQLHK